MLPTLPIWAGLLLSLPYAVSLGWLVRRGRLELVYTEAVSLFAAAASPWLLDQWSAYFLVLLWSLVTPVLYHSHASARAPWCFALVACVWSLAVTQFFSPALAFIYLVVWAVQMHLLIPSVLLIALGLGMASGVCLGQRSCDTPFDPLLYAFFSGLSIGLGVLGMLVVAPVLDMRREPVSPQHLPDDDDDIPLEELHAVL